MKTVLKKIKISELFNLDKKKYNFNPEFLSVPDFQRPDTIWGTTKEISFIECLKYNPSRIPPIHIGFYDDKGYILDGLQRMTSIKKEINRQKDEKLKSRILNTKINIFAYYGLENEDQAQQIFDSLNKGEPLAEIDLKRGSGSFCKTLKWLRENEVVLKLIHKKNITELEKKIASVIFLSKNSNKYNSSENLESQYKELDDTKDWNKISPKNPKAHYQKYVEFISGILDPEDFSSLKKEDSSVLFISFIFNLPENLLDVDSQLAQSIKKMVKYNFFGLLNVDVEKGSASGTIPRKKRYNRIKSFFESLVLKTSKTIPDKFFKQEKFSKFSSKRQEPVKEMEKSIKKASDIEDKEREKIKKKELDLVKADLQKQSAVKKFKELIKNEASEDDMLLFLRNNKFLFNLCFGAEYLFHEFMGEESSTQVGNYSRGDFLCSMSGSLVAIEFKKPGSLIFGNKPYRDQGPWELNSEIIHGSIQSYSNGTKYIDRLNKNPKLMQELNISLEEKANMSTKQISKTILVIGKDHELEIKQKALELSMGNRLEQERIKDIMISTWGYLDKVLNVEIYTYRQLIEKIELIIKSIKG